LLAAFAAAVLALALPHLGPRASPLVPGLAAVLALAALGLQLWIRRRRWSDTEIARRIEARHPDLNALLLTAVEHRESELPDFLRQRLLAEAAAKAAVQAWPTTVARPALRRAAFTLVAAAALCAAAWIWLLTVLPQVGAPTVAATTPAEPAPAPAPALEIEVRPGDTDLEQGSRLVV